MPSSIDDYVHRIGRTGRVGNSGRATSFFDPEHDRALGGDLIKILEGSGQVVPDFLMEMGGGSFSSSKFGGIDVRGGASTQVKPNFKIICVFYIYICCWFLFIRSLMQRLTTWRMKKDGIKVELILDYDQTEYIEHIIL